MEQTKLPLVAILDGQSTDVEEKILTDMARVLAFDVRSVDQLEQAVLDETEIALVYYLINLNEEGLRKFAKLRHVVRLGAGFNNIDVHAAARLGNIGTAVAERAKAFGFEICFFDAFYRPGIDRALGIRRCDSVAELLGRSHCVTLHCPLTAENHHLISRHSIEHMRPGALLVNVSRGALVDEAALAAALRCGRVAAAALDVHETEPFDFTSGPLAGLKNLVCTPHSAWFSEEAEVDQRALGAAEARRSLAGRLPGSLRNCVNRHLLAAQH